MSLSDVPAKPFWANNSSAATRISSRREIGSTVSDTMALTVHRPTPVPGGTFRRGPALVVQSASMIRATSAVLASGRQGPTGIEVVGGRIAALHPLADDGAPGWTLVPGFVDLQVNGIDSVDVATARVGDWEDLDRALVAQGVTAWCPTLVSTAPLDQYPSALARIGAAAARAEARPAILGAHLEGPFLGDRHGAHPDEMVVVPDADSGTGLVGLRLMTVGPEAPGALDLIRALVGEGVVVAVGHTGTDPATLTAAVDAGASLFTHLFNASGTVGARSPAPSAPP